MRAFLSFMSWFALLTLALASTFAGAAADVVSPRPPCTSLFVTPADDAIFSGVTAGDAADIESARPLPTVLATLALSVPSQGLRRTAPPAMMSGGWSLKQSSPGADASIGHASWLSWVIIAVAVGTATALYVSTRPDDSSDSTPTPNPTPPSPDPLPNAPQPPTP